MQVLKQKKHKEELARRQQRRKELTRRKQQTRPDVSQQRPKRRSSPAVSHEGTRRRELKTALRTRGLDPTGTSADKKQDDSPVFSIEKTGLSQDPLANKVNTCKNSSDEQLAQQAEIDAVVGQAQRAGHAKTQREAAQLASEIAVQVTETQHAYRQARQAWQPAKDKTAQFTSPQFLSKLLEDLPSEPNDAPDKRNTTWNWLNTALKVGPKMPHVYSAYILVLAQRFGFVLKDVEIAFDLVGRMAGHASGWH